MTTLQVMPVIFLHKGIVEGNERWATRVDS